MNVLQLPNNILEEFLDFKPDLTVKDAKYYCATTEAAKRMATYWHAYEEEKNAKFYVSNLETTITTVFEIRTQIGCETAASK
nr:unnamed protein product [Callosobruchus analis]